MTSCDEITFPRCSWAHFVNFVQPLQFDYELFGSANPSLLITREFLIPYIQGDCWPIRTVEQASIIYIYAACTVYWDIPGFDRQVSLEQTFECKIKSHLVAFVL